MEIRDQRDASDHVRVTKFAAVVGMTTTPSGCYRPRLLVTDSRFWRERRTSRRKFQSTTDRPRSDCAAVRSHWDESGKERPLWLRWKKEVVYFQWENIHEYGCTQNWPITGRRKQRPATSQ